MQASLIEIRGELEQLSIAVKALPSNEPFNIAHGAWNLPGLTRDELLGDVQDVVSIIDLYGDGVEGGVVGEGLLSDYPRRLSFLRLQTVPQFWGGNGQQAVSSFHQTLHGLKIALAPIEGESTTIKAKEAAKSLTRATSQIRAIEARIKNLDPRSMTLLETIEKIEHASEAADHLPTDLATLAEARESIRGFVADSNKDRATIEQALSDVKLMRDSMTTFAQEAEVIIKRCFDAHRAQSSDGLASAFAERSTSIAMSMWVWVNPPNLATPRISRASDS